MPANQQRDSSDDSNKSWSTSTTATSAPTSPTQGGVTPPPASGSTGTAATPASAAVQNIADDAQQKVGQTVDQVREMGKSRLASQKDRVAGTVDSVARALRDTSKNLQQGDDQFVAEYIDGAAERIEHFSGQLRQRSVDELLGEAEGFARRQPALFLGGAFFLGALAARFLKSSRPMPPAMASGQGPRYGSPYGGASPARYSWQDASLGSRPAALPARPPTNPPPYTGGSAYPSPGPRSS
jgi:hypothetical protein